jgi:ferredoxin
MNGSAYEIRITEGAAEKYRFACRGDEPLLNGIRRAFCAEIPRGCSGGGCGVCKVVVKRGEYFRFKPMSRAHVTEDEIARKVALACCIRPRSDMEIGFFESAQAQSGRAGAMITGSIAVPAQAGSCR